MLAPLLVVEDDPDDLYFLTRLLKQAGVANPLYVASDGEEAVALLSRLVNGEKVAPPVLALVDIKMPRMDGFAVLDWIRRQRALDYLPVVILSSSSEASDVTRAARLGAQYFFAKHPPAATIERVVAAAVRQGAGGRSVPRVPHDLLPATSAAG